MKILKYNKFKFLNESYSDFNQFSQMGMGPSPLGPGYGFAVDKSLSIYGNQDSPYVDQYARTPMFVNTLMGVIKNLYKDTINSYTGIKHDQFLEDVDLYTNLKILRINTNENLTLDVYISFTFNEEEFFGVYKKFNWIEREELKTDLFSDSQFTYIDGNYILKLDNYLFQILTNWFKPKNLKYLNLNKDGIICRDKMGNKFLLPENSIINVVGSNVDKDDNTYIVFEYKEEKYIINKNNYYFFNYWFEEYNEKEELI